MWVLKRLIEKGVKREDILMTYKSRIRTHLERNSPLFHYSISNKLSNKIEKVQKACVFIILGKSAKANYCANLKMLDLESMFDRREKLCKNFARKSTKNSAHRNMYTWSKGIQTRAKPKVIIPHAKTKRYATSAIPSLSRLINTL